MTAVTAAERELGLGLALRAQEPFDFGHQGPAIGGLGRRGIVEPIDDLFHVGAGRETGLDPLQIRNGARIEPVEAEVEPADLRQPSEQRLHGGGRG